VFAEPSTLSNGDISLAESDLIVFTPAGTKLLNVKKAIDISIASITISNMLGQQVSRFNTAGQDGIVSVSTEGITNGNYTMTMQTNLGSVARKVIIQ
jgi:hypothetical protein